MHITQHNIISKIQKLKAGKPSFAEANIRPSIVVAETYNLPKEP